jgi:hypothetical protein
MVERTSSASTGERRKELRTDAKQFYSVEIYIREITRRYQFKLRDISEKGMGILVKEDSLILDHLGTGKILPMRYHPLRGPVLSEELNTRIQHVTRCESGRYHGHFVVGLQILENNGENSV